MPFAKDELLSAVGGAATNQVVHRLRCLAHISDARLSDLSRVALSENWGNDDYVLEKYLAVHIAWSIERQRYTASDNQLYATAGHLQTRYGTPLYIVFEHNTTIASI
jgi:hypothetical protein